MLSKKIKIIALASALSTCVLTGTAVAGSYTPSLAEANAPTFLRRTLFAVNSGLVPGTAHVHAKEGVEVNKDYSDPFEIKIIDDAENNEFTVKLNSSKTTYAAANIQSMFLLNLGPINSNTFTCNVGNQNITSDFSLAETLHPDYKNAAFFVDNHYATVPGPTDSDAYKTFYFDLSSITGDVTEFTIKANKTDIDITKFKGGIAFVYGCENR